MRFADIDSCGTDAVRMQLNRKHLTRMRHGCGADAATPHAAKAHAAENRMQLNRTHLSLTYSDSASLSDLSSKSAKVHQVYASGRERGVVCVR